MTEPTPAPYRVLVTGSRDWDTPAPVHGALAAALTAAAGRPLTVVHGACPTGADMIAHVWAISQFAPDGTPTAISEPHPAAWHLHGRAAGPRRNAEMVAAGAHLCLAFIRNGSRGASHTAALAERAGIETRRFTA